MNKATNPFGGFVHTSPLSAVPHHPPHTLVSNILRDYFGPTVQTIADALFSQGPSTLPQLIAHIQSHCKREGNSERSRLTGGRLVQTKGLTSHGYVVEKEVIGAGLVVLLQHSLLFLKKGDGDVSKSKVFRYKYSLDLERCRYFVRYPKYVEYAKRSVDENAGIIVEEILVNGRLTTEAVVHKSVDTLENFILSGRGDADDDDDENDAPTGLEEGEKEEMTDGVVKSFKKLVDGGYLEMIPPLDANDKDGGEAEMDFTDLITSTLKPNKELTPDAAPSSNGNSSTVPDQNFTLPSLQKHSRSLHPGAVWRVNISMFHSTIRAHIFGRLVSERYETKISHGGPIITAALKFSTFQQHSPSGYQLSNDEVLKREEEKGIFTPDSIMEFLPNQVLAEMKNRAGGARVNISQAMVDLGEFIWPQVCMEVEEALGHPLGGKFEVAIRSLREHLQMRIMHQLILDHYGEVAARICSILQTKGCLESEQIADAVMAPAKDVRELLHILYMARYVSLTSLHQSKTHNPPTAIYLWSVQRDRLFQTVFENVCTALLNIRLRRQHEIEVGKDWIERAKEAGAQDENDSELDKLNYLKFCSGLERLDNASLQLDETLMVLKDFT